MSQIAAIIFWLALLLMCVLAAILSMRLEVKTGQMRRRRAQQEQQTALLLHPGYQAKVAADRAYILQRERQTAELELKRADFALKQYALLHRVPAETYVVNEAIQSMTALPSLKAAAETKLAVAPQPAQQEESLPYAPPFASVRPLIQPGRLVLGYSADGPVWGDVGDLLSMAFAGMPGTGKSSALLYFLAILSLVKAQTHVIDPHGSLNELAGFLSYCDDPAELGTFLPDLYAAFEHRKQLWKSSRTVLDPFLVLVDELPVIARYEQKHQADYSLLELAETIVLEGRKLNMFCILAGQSFPATVLPTLTRDNLSSRIVFNSKEMHARMAGLDKDTRATMLPLLRRAQPGTAILDVARKSDPCIVSLPFTTVDDLRNVIESVPGVPGVPHRSSPYGNGVPPLVEPFPLFPRTSGERTETAKNSVSPEERERILTLQREGVPRREMCARLGKGKGYYDTIKTVLGKCQQAEEA